MANYNAVTDVQFSNEGTTEPVTLSAVKAWLYIESSDTSNDDLLTSLIKVAREQIEKATNNSLITRTVTAIVVNKCGNVFLPYQPITSDVTFVDANDDTLDLTVKGLQFKQVVTKADYIKATYDAGYSTVPEMLKLAVKQQVAFLFENRGDVNVSSVAISSYKPFIIP